MAEAADHLPDDTDALKAVLIETRAKLVGAQALIEHLQLVIAKMQREKFGPRSEKSQRLIDQLDSVASGPVIQFRSGQPMQFSSGVDTLGFALRLCSGPLFELGFGRCLCLRLQFHTLCQHVTAA